MSGILVSPRSFLGKSLTIAELEARKIRHDPLDLFTRVVQPVLWLAVFGQVLAQVKVIPTGGMPYLDFMTPGILAQSVLFISIFYGISLVWERDLGIVQKFLVSPTPRTALVTGKALSAGGFAACPRSSWCSCWPSCWGCTWSWTPWPYYWRCSSFYWGRPSSPPSPSSSPAW